MHRGALRSVSMQRPGEVAGKDPIEFVHCVIQTGRPRRRVHPARLLRSAAHERGLFDKERASGSESEISQRGLAETR